MRTGHAGVKLLRRIRKASEVWLARWTDPDTGRPREASLTALGLTSEETRRSWCIRKSESVRQRRAALAAGAALATSTGPEDAVAGFFARRATLKTVTLASYRNGSDAFLVWSKSRGIHKIEALMPKHVMDFRAWWVARPKLRQLNGYGVGRGARSESDRKRSPLTINRGLRVVSSMLNEWRMMGLTPNLSSDAIRDALRYERRQKPLPRFLNPREVRELLSAAILHDKAKFKITRAEHAGALSPGSTARYEPIAPFVAAALLTGCRFEELASLSWQQVGWDVRQIVLTHEHTKTGQGRIIDLAPTPMLLDLLQATHAKSEGAFCFGGGAALRRALAEAARKRLTKRFGAPRFTWHDLRRTCGTYLTCAPGIYGGASAYLSAKRLGHSVVVAETHYTGALTGIDPKATTLESAMGIDDLVATIVAGLRGEHDPSKREAAGRHAAIGTHPMRPRTARNRRSRTA